MARPGWECWSLLSSILFHLGNQPVTHSIRLFFGGSKRSRLWYTVTSVDLTLSIRNFNNLKSLQGGLKGSRVETKFPAEIQRFAVQ
jgi:hypothetical protein